MRTYLTGDMHGYVDSRFGRHNRERMHLYPHDGDLLVVLGDMGVLFDTKPDEWAEGRASFTDRPMLYGLRESWPGPVAFVDGNHDNHPLLASLDTEERWGGTVGVVTDGVYHLRRGGVYDLPSGDGIGTVRVWCMGGAWSVDRASRKRGRSWWPEEIPSEGEIAAARRALDCEGWETGFVLTHECPSSVRPALTEGSPFGRFRHTDRLQELLDEVDGGARFARWYCGHYHVNRDVGCRHTCLYRAVVPLGEPAGEVYERGDGAIWRHL